LSNKPSGEDDKPKGDKGLDNVLAFLVSIASLVTGAIPSKQNPGGDTNSANEEVAKWTRVVGRWTRGLVAVGVLTVGVVGFQAVILYNQLNEAREEQRPWITVSVEPAGPITWNYGGMQVFYEIVLKNIGKSPAFGVRHTEGVIVDKGADFRAYENSVIGVANVQRERANIMPKDDRRMIVHYQVQKLDIDSGAKPWTDSGGPKLIVPVLAGVIEYLTQFDTVVRHTDFFLRDRVLGPR
jgi:hypothetical protein